ncbi:S-adenosylmethionine uptake transporter [Rhizobium azooxidifex]|jgi:S-adenosylmethionine uptake transporter|uniref:S-adenosylmethionine uptake transporter n=1 Tax=Mycoplana azooxidifex TaxID=1636188 RepID=A0A7W6DC32_9HYPH|nr:DMT family transporter [Mycoplana azooxidifex]MBB3979794.1 S-adenosylmethionine uptake transporter [Mycoplana azooxidifex]
MRGAILGFTAFAVFSGTDVLVKLLAERFAVPQVTFMVTVAALLLLLVQVGTTGTLASLLPRYPGLALARAFLLALDTILIHYAFSMLPLSEAYLLAFLTPILVAVLAFLLLGERLSPIAWSGVIVGFFGVAIALRPGMISLNLGHAAAAGSALVFALSLLLLRRTKQTEPDMALVSTLLVVLAAVALGAALSTGGFEPIGMSDLLSAFAGGLFLFGGHLLLVRAFRTGDASVVAPFQYSQIIWGCLYGALFFAAPTELHTLAGALVIILSGWLVLK